MNQESKIMRRFVAVWIILFGSVYANIDDNLKFKLDSPNPFLKRPSSQYKFTQSDWEILRSSPIPLNFTSTMEFE